MAIGRQPLAALRSAGTVTPRTPSGPPSLRRSASRHHTMGAADNLCLGMAAVYSFFGVTLAVAPKLCWGESGLHTFSSLDFPSTCRAFIPGSQLPTASSPRRVAQIPAAARPFESTHLRLA